MADGFERCYHKAFGPRRDLEAKLTAQKKSEKEVSEAIAAAQKAGTLPPAPPGMMSYRGYDKRDRIQNLWVWSQPNATPEQIGVSTTSQRENALEGHGLPWMMLPGTPGSHIMIPINPTPKTSSITDEAADEVTQATLPLPEDLRAGAAVYKYDPKTGNRVVLRPGTNTLECMPRGADGFTWCYNKVSAPRRDMSAKLRAQGADDKAIQLARRGGHQGRDPQADAVRHDVVPALWQTRSHPVAVGTVGAGRHAGHHRRDDGERA